MQPTSYKYYKASWNKTLSILLNIVYKHYKYLNSLKETKFQVNKYFNTMIPFETQKKLGDFSGFLSSNTMIARVTFLLGVLILFSILFYVGSKIVSYFISPS